MGTDPVLLLQHLEKDIADRSEERQRLTADLESYLENMGLPKYVWNRPNRIDPSGREGVIIFDEPRYFREYFPFDDQKMYLALPDIIHTLLIVRPRNDDERLIVNRMTDAIRMEIAVRIMRVVNHDAMLFELCMKTYELRENIASLSTERIEHKVKEYFEKGDNLIDRNSPNVNDMGLLNECDAKSAGRSSGMSSDNRIVWYGSRDQLTKMLSYLLRDGIIVRNDYNENHIKLISDHFRIIAEPVNSPADTAVEISSSHTRSSRQLIAITHQSTLVYLIDQLIENGKISRAIDGGREYEFVTHHFTDASGKTLTNANLLSTRSNTLGNIKKKPRGGKLIDRILDEILGEEP